MVASQAETLRKAIENLIDAKLHDALPPVASLGAASAGVDAVLARATAKDADARFPSVDDFAAELVAALEGRPVAISVEPREAPRNPYKGLRAFQEAVGSCGGKQW